MGEWKRERLTLWGSGVPYCQLHRYDGNKNMFISEDLHGTRPLHLVIKGVHLERTGDDVESLKRWVEAVTELGR